MNIFFTLKLSFNLVPSGDLQSWEIIAIIVEWKKSQFENYGEICVKCEKRMNGVKKFGYTQKFLLPLSSILSLPLLRGLFTQQPHAQSSNFHGYFPLKYSKNNPLAFLIIFLTAGKKAF
jgi:hypothetical protein